MGEFVEVAEARTLSGLRLVLTLGVPGPWSEAAKGILYVKKIPYVRVRQELGGPNTELTEWTAQATAPVAIWNDEPPRSTWIEQLFLAERLEPTPALIPDNIEDRMLMFGYCNELCGEHGYGWSKRLMLLHTVLTDSDADESARAFATHMGNKYGYTREEAEAAPARVASIVTMLGSRLEQQHEQGQSVFYRQPVVRPRHLLGRVCRAYPAAAARTVSDAGNAFRTMYINTDPVVQAAVKPILLEHRDFIYQEYLELPIDL